MARLSPRRRLLWLGGISAVSLAVFLALVFVTEPRRLGEVPTAEGLEPTPRPKLWESSLQGDGAKDETSSGSSWATPTVFTDVRTEMAPETVDVQGSFVRIDRDGAEHPHEDGSFEFSVWGPVVPQGHPADPGRRRLRRQQVTKVEVCKGRWEASLPGHTSRRIAKGRLGGHPLFDIQVVELESGEPGRSELRLTGRALYPARISVVDRKTLHDLTGVRIVGIGPDDVRSHPGDLAPIVSAGASPLELPAPESDRRVYLVGADGYAWQRVEWDHRSDAPRIVELERSGSLAVEITVDFRVQDCAVTLTRLGADAPSVRILTDVALDGEPLRIGGLAPGEYRVGLVPESSLVQEQAASLVQAETTVVAGEIARVALRRTLGDPPPTVEFACRIRLSKAWSAGGPHIVVRAQGRTALWHMETGGVLGEVEVEPYDGDWLVRSSAAIADGAYLLSERRTGFVREIEMGREGTGEVLLVIPDPVELRVEVVDRETGGLLPSSELRWHPPRPASVPSPPSSRLWIQEADRDGVFLARVPAWEQLEFEASAAGFETWLGTLQPDPSAASRLRIPLERRSSSTPLNQD